MKNVPVPVLRKSKETWNWLNNRHRAAILAGKQPIRRSHFMFGDSVVKTPAQPVPGQAGQNLLSRRHGRLSQQEVRSALSKCGGHRSRAAALLGISERTLYRYIQRLRDAPAEDQTSEPG